MFPSVPMGINAALDPLTGNLIAPTDPNYSKVELYYQLKAIYQPEVQKALDYYLNYTWHDYAVTLLQTASALGVTSRPPGYKNAPIPPSVHQVSLLNGYLVRITESPVCSIPPDPNPATDVVRVTRGIDGLDVTTIVKGLASTGTIAATINAGSSSLSTEQVIAFLKSLSSTDLNNIIAQVFA